MKENKLNNSRVSKHEIMLLIKFRLHIQIFVHVILIVCVKMFIIKLFIYHRINLSLKSKTKFEFRAKKLCFIGS